MNRPTDLDAFPPLSDEYRDSIASAIESAVAMCHETQLELVVPPEFVLDVLLNCCSGTMSRLLRPEFRKWVRCQINTLPNLDEQQRDVLQKMAFQCPPA